MKITLFLLALSTIAMADIKPVKIFDGKSATCKIRPDVFQNNFGTVFYDSVDKVEFADHYEFIVKISMFKCVDATENKVKYVKSDLFEIFDVYYFNHQTKKVDSYDGRHEQLEVMAFLSPGAKFVDVMPVEVIDTNKGIAKITVLKEDIKDAKSLTINVRGIAITFFDDKPVRHKLWFGAARLLNIFNSEQ